MVKVSAQLNDNGGWVVFIILGVIANPNLWMCGGLMPDPSNAPIECAVRYAIACIRKLYIS